MKVAFHLRRRTSPEPASAVLLESDRVEALIDLASKLGPDRLPPTYRVEGGFLLKLGEGAEPPPGPIRLRKLAEDLYLPFDADLVPSLLDDEARGVTRDRGVVFLPGGRVLGFEPGRPLPISSLVTAGRREGSGWRPFPDRPDRPDRLREVALESPDESAEDAFEAGGDSGEIGTESPPRPEGAGAASTLAGRAAVGAGQGMIGLGAMLGIKALADLGAKWINRAVERVPRLTEAMIGRQEGSLRELLRQFREGDVEQALRRALPLAGAGSRGGNPSVDGRLPTVDPTYSLRELLGSNRGATGLWFGAFDVQAELAKEYRKVAEEAERRGDYRRAAYIHGKLLNDLLTAAHLLCRAGLYRDAAYLYLNRLKDVPAAARAFEAAGEVDRALQIYRQNRLHAEAGDLLRRVGEEDEAVAEYLWAADMMAEDPKHGRLAAGDLLRDRAGRPDLALGYYAKGWDERPSTVAVPCALRMASIYADRGDVPPLMGLVDQADDLLKAQGRDVPAIEFYNELARLADREALAGARDDLRDRSLMGLANKLRQKVATNHRPGQLASTYLGRNKSWSPDQVSDATLAVRLAFDLESERRRVLSVVLGAAVRPEPRRIELDGGTVSAACHSSSTGEVFVGFEGGRVFGFDPASGVVRCLTEERPPIASMAVDAEGQTLVLMLGEGPGPRRLVHLDRSRSSTGSWSRQARMIGGSGEFWLTPVMSDGPVRALGVFDGEDMILMGGIGELSTWSRLPMMTFLKTEPPAAILIPPIDGKSSSPRAVLVHDGPDLCQVEAMGKMIRRRYLGWRPTLPDGNTLRSAQLSWLQVDSERFELAGLDGDGVISWSSLKINDAELIRTSNHSSGAATYAAATLVRAGLVAGVSPSRVDWLRCGPHLLAPAGSIELSAPAPLACFPAHRTDELIVVCRDGTLVCVPTPR